MVDRIHARHHRRQHLRGADVGGGLLAADVLLAGLEGEPIGGPALGIDAHAHKAARHRALHRIAAGEKSGVGSAAPHRHPEPLRGADHDVGPPLSRRHQQREREGIGGHAQQRLFGMHLLGKTPPVGKRAVGGGVLHQCAEAIVLGQQLFDPPHADVDPQRLGPRRQHFERLRMAAVIGEKDLAGA